jgi:hypothetical protein
MLLVFILLRARILRFGGIPSTIYQATNDAMKVSLPF